MINMQDKSMIFTLNGEILITTKGSELCFTDFDTGDGEKDHNLLFEAESNHRDIFRGHFFNEAFPCRENSIHLETQ